MNKIQAFFVVSVFVSCILIAIGLLFNCLGIMLILIAGIPFIIIVIIALITLFKK